MPGPRRTPRRRLVLLLSGSAGYLDAVGYLTLGLFTANMTGNTVLLGIAVGQGHLPAVARVVLALGAFLAGAAAAAAILAAGRRVAGAFALETLCLIAAFGAWVHLGAGRVPPRAGEPAVYPLIVLLSAAMGAQSAAVRGVGEQRVSTTYVTGILTSLAVDAVSDLLRRSWPLRGGGTRPVPPQPPPQPLLGAIWGSYLLGGAAGGFAQARYAFLAVAVPCLVLAGASAWDAFGAGAAGEEPGGKERTG
jgi:uncharacterized membrane protein YoaK (UPF0700 family)